MGKSIDGNKSQRPKCCRIKIRGMWWRILISRPPENYCSGLCNIQTRTIYIRPTAKNKFETLVHEILHACLWDLTEEAVMETEEAIVKGLRLLERTCFRQKPLNPL